MQGFSVRTWCPSERRKRKETRRSALPFGLLYDDIASSLRLCQHIAAVHPAGSLPHESYVKSRLCGWGGCRCRLDGTTQQKGLLPPHHAH